MSRPIPEGVEPPRPNTVIQGWGGDFIVPRGGFSGWKSDNKGKSWREGDGLRGCDPDSLYAAPFLSDVNTLNAPSLETSLGLAPGSFGKFIKGMEEKAIRESEEYFSNLRTKINEAADRDSEVALLNRKQVPLNSGEAYSIQPPDKDALIRELVGAAQWAQVQLGKHTRPSPLDSALTLARTTCPEAFDGCNENSTS